MEYKSVQMATHKNIDYINISGRYPSVTAQHSRIPPPSSVHAFTWKKGKGASIKKLIKQLICKLTSHPFSRFFSRLNKVWAYSYNYLCFCVGLEVEQPTRINYFCSLKSLFMTDLQNGDVRLDLFQHTIETLALK